jgi:hypothetical protein
MGQAGGTAAGGIFVSDIFNEVDEEVRREQLKKLWDKYGLFVIALAVLVVVGVGGYRAYDWYQMKQAAEAGTAFEDAVKLSADGKHAEAEAAFAKVATEGTPAYKVLARMREANEAVSRDPKAAVDIYDKLAADGSVGQTFQDLAAIRAGNLLVDTAPFADVQKRLEPLTAAGRPFRHSARMLLALAAWKANDAAALKKWSDMIIADAESPSGTRGQIEMLNALTASGGKS